MNIFQSGRPYGCIHACHCEDHEERSDVVGRGNLSAQGTDRHDGGGTRKMGARMRSHFMIRANYAMPAVMIAMV